MNSSPPQDTAQALTPTDSRALYVLKLKADVDALSMIYNDIKDRCDRCNQSILIISSIGALTSSITSIAGITGWEIEIVPIIVQTLSGVLAAWIRFYDFPKRMESIINAKKGANDVKLKFEQSPNVDQALWNDYTSIQHEIDNAITPEERNAFMHKAIRLRKDMIMLDADIHDLLLAKIVKDGECNVNLLGTTGRSPRIISHKEVSRKLTTAVGRRGSGIEFSAPAIPMHSDDTSSVDDDSMDVNSSALEDGGIVPPLAEIPTHQETNVDGNQQETVVTTLPNDEDV